MPEARPKDWKAPPVNPETDAYKKYLENQRNRGPGAARFGRTPEEKRWDQWKSEKHTTDFQKYVDYRNDTSGNRVRDERDDRMDQYEKDTFGGPLDPDGGSDKGKYTLDDLYIKMSDKRWEDQRRKDLLIDPNKKKKQDQQTPGPGGGKKGGGRKTGGKTGGPGNPNTGGGGAAGGPNL